MVRVGIIGAGVSGLLCAQRLLSAADQALNVSVFEWGRGPGGRTARRRVTLPGAEVSFDHAAPYFKAETSEFRAILAEWEVSGYVARWPEAGDDSTWVGVPSNHAICRSLADEVTKRSGSMLYGRHVRATHHEATSDKWIVQATNRADGKDEEYRFDALIFSDKLLLLPNAYSVLEQSEWGPLALPPTLESTGAVVLMMAIERPAADSIAPMLTSVRAPLKLMVRDSAKPGRSTAAGGLQPPLDLWVAHSSPEYAKAHLVGDDPPGMDDESAVLAQMQEAALATLAAAEQTCAGAAAKVAHASVFMWDHAQPAAESRLQTTHLLDARRRAGVCGDFFAGSDGRDGVEAAALSGRNLADALLPLLGCASSETKD